MTSLSDATLGSYSYSGFGVAFSATEPVFAPQSSYGPSVVVPKSMEDLKDGQFRVNQFTTYHRLIENPVTLDWLVDAFKADAVILNTLLEKMAATKKPGGDKEAKTTDYKAEWFEALAGMSFDVKLLLWAVCLKRINQPELWPTSLIPLSGTKYFDATATAKAIRDGLATLEHPPVTATMFASAQGSASANLFGPPPAAPVETKGSAGSGSGSGSGSGAFAGSAPSAPPSLFADGVQGQKRARTVTCPKGDCCAEWPEDDQHNVCGKCGTKLIKTAPPAAKRHNAGTFGGNPTTFGFVSVPAAAGDDAGASALTAQSQSSMQAMRERSRVLRESTIESNAVAELEHWLPLDTQKSKRAAPVMSLRLEDGMALFSSEAKVRPRLSNPEWQIAFGAYMVDMYNYALKTVGQAEATKLHRAMFSYISRFNTLVFAGRPWSFLVELDVAWRSGIAKGDGSWLQPSQSIFASLQMDLTSARWDKLDKLAEHYDTLQAQLASSGSPRTTTTGSQQQVQVTLTKCSWGAACYRRNCRYVHPAGHDPAKAKREASAEAKQQPGSGVKQTAKKGKQQQAST